MSKKRTFLKSTVDKDVATLRKEITERDNQLRSLKFELGFGKVDALTAIRTAKRERAQLLTMLSQKLTASKE